MTAGRGTEGRYLRTIVLLIALFLIVLPYAGTDAATETKTSGGQEQPGALNGSGYGRVKISKISSDPSMTEGNPSYDLSGARYTLYEDISCSAAAKTRSGDRAVLTIGDDGISNVLEIGAGSYYMKETKAPPGYAIDSDVHSLDIHSDKTTTYMAADKPKSDPVRILLQKTDKETGLAKPQGGASLAGAEYTVRFYAVTPPEGKTGEELAACIAGKAPAKIDGKDAEWVFRTDEAGRVDMSDPDSCLVKERSAALYRDSSGRPAFPIGIISVKETAAPEGYELDNTTYYAAVTDSGQEETLSTLNTFTGKSSLKGQVVRGDVCLVRTSGESGSAGSVPLSFTSQTTGESHILVTDGNGRASTAAEWSLHSSNTNAGESSKDGVWFSGSSSESTGAKANDSLGALPYDTYRMEELRCGANSENNLLAEEIAIEKPRMTVDLGTYDDRKTAEPVIETKAKDDESGSSTAVADSKVIIVDEVSYSGVPAGKTYTVEGMLMDKESGEPLKDKGGSEVRGSTEFYAGSTEGKAEVRFEMDASSLGGKDAVAFEYLKQDGELIAAHADINDTKQTVKLEEASKPEISTDARDGESGSGKAEADKDVWIIDTVEYRNLTPDETYLLCGLLVDRETGRPVPDDSGKEIRSSAQFTARAESGSQEISFRFSGESLAGKDVVVFEYLYLKQTLKIIASHEDIRSRKQTVRLVEAKAPPSPEQENTEKKKSPDTGDSAFQALYCLAAMAAALEMAVLTLRRRNDRLKRGE